MKKILLLGGRGMAGHMVNYYLEKTGKYDIVNTCFQKKANEKSILLDVRNKEKIKDVIDSVKPDIVINCVGILIKEANENPKMAMEINGFFPHYLEELGKEKHFMTIHLSTDCIFSGEKGNYTTEDIPDADDYYGKSKAVGELKNDRDLTIRTSIIGPELNPDGVGLFQWFMSQKDEINGYDKVYWTGLTTLELAKIIDRAIEINLTGLHHIVPDQKISKYDLLNLIAEIFQKDIVIKRG
jgi:dTDP-4-dehydrorhamnose reductase